MPKISVIVPVYKAESFLESCIDSILSQSFSDFEIILVNDGSPDGSGRLCDGYAAKYDCITVIHQENQGQAAARNHALVRSRGQWICFVDSDDLIHPRMLEWLYRAAEESGAPVSMCGMLEAVTLPGDFFENREPAFQTLTMDEETLTALHDADRYPAWVACGKLIRRELVESYPFREGRVYEDNEAVCRWVCQGGSLAWTGAQLYFYRGNPDSTTKAAFRLKNLDYLWALESIIGFYTGLGYEKLRERFISRYIDAAISCCNGARHLLHRPDVVRQIEKQTKTFLRREKIRLTRQQFEGLLDVTHPVLIRLYWPVSGAITTLRRQGIAGVFRKIRKILVRRNEGENP